MKRTVSLLLIAAALAAFATASYAGTVREERREANQQARIAQGARSGALTPRETARLERGQAHVDRMEARAKANDGKIGPVERNRIERAQNRQSRRIHRLKHNARVSG
jgi:hypothetical protein